MDPTSHHWYHNPPPLALLPPTFYQPLARMQTKGRQPHEWTGPNGNHGSREGPPAGDVQWNAAADVVKSADADAKTTCLDQAFDSCDGDDDDSDNDTSAEFMAFIAQSAAHRQERDSKKQLAEKKQQNIGRYSYASPNPTEAPGVARRRQYKQLYGKELDLIQAFEARANLAHDNLVDAHAPTLWPALPLKM